MASEDLSQLTSPMIKLVRFFKKSRDRWKAKHHELKKTLKHWQNQTRAVEKSRQAWRERAVAASQRVAELECQIQQLKSGGEPARRHGRSISRRDSSGPSCLLG